jgi:tetratricopeptide (TPR) repeat protein
MTWRFLATRGLVCVAALAGRPETASAQADRPTAAAVGGAIDGWLAATARDQNDLDAAVAVVLDAGGTGLGALEQRMRTALERGGANSDEARARRENLELLLRGVVLQYFERERASEMRFEAQYAPLRVLMPYAGRFYLGLVLETPEWFPSNLRAQLVPALRDLYPSPPPQRDLARLRDLADDVDFESEDLRCELSYALAQWGDRELVDARLEELRRNAGEGKTAEELVFLRALADTHYRLREYETAATLWSKCLRSSEELAVQRAPVDYYNAACCLSRTGSVEQALDELDRCCALIRSDDVDRSLKLEKKLFDNDPDLLAVRSTKRFRELLQRTFPVNESKQ